MGTNDRVESIETYHELAFSSEVAVAHTQEGIVVLPLTEGSGVDIGGEEADGGEDSAVE